MTKSQFKLWFFRDLSDEQRMKLYRLAKIPLDDAAPNFGTQHILLDHVLKGLSHDPS